MNKRHIDEDRGERRSDRRRANMQVEVCLDLEDELTEESINKYCHMYWYYALVLQCKGCFYIKEQYLQALKNK